MSNLNAKEMLKSLDGLTKQANKLLNETLTPHVMSKLTPQQLAQVKNAKKDIKTLGKKGLNIDSKIFENLK